jgi:hypothetical protein
LGDAYGGGAGGLEVDGEAEMVEGELAVFAGDGEEAGGVESLVEGVGEGVADPGEGGLAGLVFEGEDEDEPAGGGDCVWCLRVDWQEEESAGEQECCCAPKDGARWEEGAGFTGPRHRMSIEASGVGRARH